MKSKLSLVLFLTAIVLIGHLAATDSAKSREKRSPKPRFGFLAKWISQVAKATPKIVKLVRQTATNIKKFVSKNPGTSAAAAAGGAAVGIGVGLGVGAQPG